MTLANLLIHSVTIYNRTAGSADARYGDETETYNGGTAYPARVQIGKTGGQARETLEGEDVRNTAIEVFLPSTAVVDGTSLIVWGSRRLQVTGEPALKYDGTGAHHIEVSATEVLGG